MLLDSLRAEAFRIDGHETTAAWIVSWFNATFGLELFGKASSQHDERAKSDSGQTYAKRRWFRSCDKFYTV
jgi:hypothetical protein